MSARRRFFYTRRKKRFILARWTVFLIIALIILWRLIPEKVLAPNRVARCIRTKRDVGILFVLQGENPSQDVILSFHYFPQERYLGVIDYPSLMAVTKDNKGDKELYKISEYIRAFGVRKTADYLSEKLGADFSFYWVESMDSFFKKMALLHGSFYFPLLSYFRSDSRSQEDEAPFREVFTVYDVKKYLISCKPEKRPIFVMNLVNTFFVHLIVNSEGEQRFTFPISRISDPEVAYFFKKGVKTNLNGKEVAYIFKSFNFSPSRYAFMVFPGGFQEVAGIKYYSPERTSYPYAIKILKSLAARRARFRRVEIRDAGGGRAGIRRVRRVLKDAYDTVYTGSEPHALTKLLVVDRVGNIATAVDIHRKLSVGDVVSWYDPEGGVVASVMVSPEAEFIVLAGEGVK